MTRPIIADYISLYKQLPTNGPGAPLTSVRGLAVHHEGGPNRPRGTSPQAIAGYHVHMLGWPHVGYKWAIGRSGQLYLLLPPENRGLHAGYTQAAGDDLSKFPNQDPQYYNNNWDSVVLIGNLDLEPASPNALDTLIKLGVAYTRGYSAIYPEFQVLGHGELPGKATSCPGKLLNMGWVRAEIKKGDVTMGDPNAPPTWEKHRSAFPTDEAAGRSALGSANEFGQVLERVYDANTKAIGKLSSVIEDLLVTQRHIGKVIGR